MSQWDELSDDERDLQLAEQALQDDTCPKCGQPREMCDDPERLWYPQRAVCHATMERLRAERLYAKRHENLAWHNGTFAVWSDKESEVTPYRYDDGVAVFVAPVDINPDDAFLSGELKRATLNG